MKTLWCVSATHSDGRCAHYAVLALTPAEAVQAVCLKGTCRGSQCKVAPLDEALFDQFNNVVQLQLGTAP